MASDNQNRPWRKVAQELANESNAARVVEVARELTLALDRVAKKPRPSARPMYSRWRIGNLLRVGAAKNSSLRYPAISLASVVRMEAAKMATPIYPPIVCAICSIPVSLEKCSTDEEGHPVHEDCYATKMEAQSKCGKPTD